MKVVVFIIAIIVLIFLMAGIQSSHESEIKEWAKSKGMEVEKIEMHVTVIGSPFYYKNDGQYIFEVLMKDKQVWWVRTGLFGNDYEKEK